MSLEVDVTFDFRTDTPPGKDPDAFSPTLRTFHKSLWSRPLPSGEKFPLDASAPSHRAYLTHSSHLGDFDLSSDSVIPTFTRWKRMQAIVTQIPEVENDAFRSIGYTMGGMMIWPRRSENGLKSINVMRGFNRRIADRMDLTLECVRRHYLSYPHPLEAVFKANAKFFDLFENFESFVSHFLLADLLNPGTNKISFFMPFNDFSGPSTPTDLSEYLRYRERSIHFVHARNARIEQLSSQWQSAREN
jgi:hypothetical protein